MKREIQLTPEQKKLYDQMKREALATLNGKTVTTMTAAYSAYEFTSNNLWSFFC